MALTLTYSCTTFFHVRDPYFFSCWTEACGFSRQEGEDQTLFAISSGELTDGLFTPAFDADCNHIDAPSEDDFFKYLPEFLVEGSAVIVFQINCCSFHGHVSARATALNWKGERAVVDLATIHEVAKQLEGDVLLTPEIESTDAQTERR